MTRHGWRGPQRSPLNPGPPACSRGRGFATVSAAMSRVARTAAAAAEPKYPVLHRAHERVAIVTPERLWTQFYIRRLDPDEAAKLAALGGSLPNRLLA